MVSSGKKLISELKSQYLTLQIYVTDDPEFKLFELTKHGAPVDTMRNIAVVVVMFARDHGFEQLVIVIETYSAVDCMSHMRIFIAICPIS